MASETIKLHAESKYGYSGQYIARLVGRDSRMQFSREFVGSKYGKRSECTSFETDEPGLFEICDVSKSGKSKEFKLVLPWRDGLVSLTSSSSDALKIAKRLGEGERLTDFVVAELGEVLTTHQYYDACSVCERELAPGEKCAEHPEGHRSVLSRQVPRLKDDGTPIRRLVYDIRTKAEAQKVDAAATLSAAVDAIVAVLAALPEPLQRKAFAAAKAKVFPKPKASSSSSDDHVRVLSVLNGRSNESVGSAAQLVELIDDAVMAGRLSESDRAEAYRACCDHLGVDA